MANARNFDYLSTGWEAVALAERAHLVRQELEQHRKTALAKLEPHLQSKALPAHLAIVLWLMFLGWGVTTCVEYMISRDIYAVIQNVSEQSVGPLLFAVALALAAVALSALLMEIVHPVFSSYFSRRETDPFRKAIIDRDQKPIDWRYAWFIGGLILTAMLTFYLYELSVQRVSLEYQAGIAAGNFASIEWMAPALFLLEVILGVSLPFVVSSVWFRYATYTARHRDTTLERREKNLVTKALETYGVSVCQREESGATVPPAPVSLELRKLIAERFGEQVIRSDETTRSKPGLPDTDGLEPNVGVEEPGSAIPDSPGQAVSGATPTVEKSNDEVAENESELRRVIDELVDSRNSEL